MTESGSTFPEDSVSLRSTPAPPVQSHSVDNQAFKQPRPGQNSGAESANSLIIRPLKMRHYSPNHFCMCSSVIM